MDSTETTLRIIPTADGSHTILNLNLDSTYHSRNGAYTESKHVFIDKGLRLQVDKGLTDIRILEIGFGTGLNALLTLMFGAKLKLAYHTLELYPLSLDLIAQYQLPEVVLSERKLFDVLHQAEWEKDVQINQQFVIHKTRTSLLEYHPELQFDLVYFDAFEPETQPELWTSQVFKNLFAWMNAGGILTTYCCKGYVRRNMLEAGFLVEKVPGPPGKREMIVAKKPL